MICALDERYHESLEVAASLSMTMLGEKKKKKVPADEGRTRSRAAFDFIRHRGALLQ